MAMPPATTNSNRVYTTPHVARNGLTPQWGQEFAFVLSHAELAMLTLRVVHKSVSPRDGKKSDKAKKTSANVEPDEGGDGRGETKRARAAASANANDALGDDGAAEVLVAENSIPVTSLRLGYRAVPLRHPESFNFIDHASVVCHFSLLDERPHWARHDE
jgi:hypothetical protein